MKSALLIVDAQNLYCSPDGRFGCAYSNRSFKTIDKAVERMRGLLWHAIRHRMPIIYLCSNKNARFSEQDGRWQTDIIAELKPPPHYPLVFWRKGKKRREPMLSRQVLDCVESNFISHVIIAGFYGHLCVVSVSMEALRANLYVTIITDSTYPAITPKKQALLRKRFLQKEILTESTLCFLRFKTQAELTNKN